MNTRLLVPVVNRTGVEISGLLLNRKQYSQSTDPHAAHTIVAGRFLDSMIRWKSCPGEIPQAGGSVRRPCEDARFVSIEGGAPHDVVVD